MKKQKFDFKNLAPKQQKALIILLCSVLGFIIVVVAASAIIFSKPKEDASSSVSATSDSSTSKVEKDEDYKFDETKTFFDEEKYKDVLLAKTDDAGEEYIKDTLFVGDSNMERLVNFNLITLNNFVGKTGMGISTFSTDACVYFENDNKGYTISKAIAKMKPRRVIMTFGTNDADSKTTAEQFVSAYKRAIQSIKKDYPYCDIIINTVPPVARQRTYNNISMQSIDKFNLALADLAKEMDIKLLDSTTLLRGDDGFGKKESFEATDGIHLTESAAKEFIKLVGTHEYKTEDKRPDTKNIPKRRNAPAANTSSSSKPTSSSSAVPTKFIVTYNVTVKDGKPLGSLTGEGFSGETTKSVTFSKDLTSFTVTAVPAEGYEFVSWSDGVKTEKRTDSKVTQKFSTTAKFQKKADPATIKIDKGDSATIVEGEAITLKAVVTGTNIDVAKVQWTLDGTKVATGESYAATGLAVGDHTITASLEKEKVSATTKVKVSKKVVPITVSIDKSSAEITEGESVTFTASVTGVADVAKVVWTLGSTQVATGASYTATGLAVGSHTIKASIEGGANTPVATVTVKAKAVPPPVKPSISLSASAAEINENAGNITITATVTNGDAATLTWEVNGAATGATGGTYTFTAGEVTADMDFTIKALLADGTSASTTIKVKDVPVVPAP